MIGHYFIRKLDSIGFRGVSLPWFSSYISMPHRKRIFLINGQLLCDPWKYDFFKDFVNTEQLRSFTSQYSQTLVIVNLPQEFEKTSGDLLLFTDNTTVYLREIPGMIFLGINIKYLQCFKL